VGWQPGTERGTGDEPIPTRPGASRQELIARLRQAQARESRAAAEKAGLLRDLIRDDDEPLPGGGYHGDLPDGWSKSLTHEVALALAMPPQSAERLMWTAWNLAARLPRTGELLAAGELTFAKARAIDDALCALSDADAARAEAMIAPELPGKTHSQAEKLAVQAALTVDPGSAARRRADAERNRARVVMRRDPSGAVNLSGYDLPADEALAAQASVCARAGQYQQSGMFPGVRMDQFRALAYLDLMNGVTAAARIAAGQPPDGLGAPGEYGPEPGPAADHPADPPAPDPPAPSPDAPRPDAPGPGEPDAGPDDSGGAPPAPDTPPPPPPPAPPAEPVKPADLIVPLATLLGLAERPGEGHGLGPLDPGLCRSLAAIAAASPHTTVCVTVTSPEGFAIGHGCARQDRNPRDRNPQGHSPPRGPLTSLPARLHVTIPASALPALARPAPRPPGDPPPPWSLTPASHQGPPDGYGAWCLTLPDGRSLTVRLGPVPSERCDHRHQSRAYQPNDTLRHLVQVRDYECTFPTCSRHARESDFEHAVPYDKGGPTCACNAGARSRACHQVKQSKGWHVTQPKPGWHQWQTPAGRTYTQGPKRYPA